MFQVQNHLTPVHRKRW